MKIGYDAKRLYKNFTGLGNYSRTLVGNLQLFYPENEYYLYTPDIRQNEVTDSFLNNAAFHTVMPRGKLKGWWRTSAIKKDLKKDRIDIFHGLSHEIPLRMQHTGIRSVVTIHDIIYRTFPDMYSLIDRKIYDFKFKYACRHADKIIAISECTKKDIIRFFGIPESKIAVIYQAIQPIFYQMQEAGEAREKVERFHIPPDYLLYVGSVNSRKNLLGIVKALRLLPSHLQLPLVIIGNGRGYKKQVEEYASAHRLSQRLIWLNNLTDSSVLQAFYQSARIFIYPSFYEGFGLPVTEALLSKVPVITSSVSSLPEAGGDYCYYVNPSQPEEIAEGIRKIIEDPTFCNKLTAGGYEFAHRQFDPRLLTQKVNDVYRELLSLRS